MRGVLHHISVDRFLTPREMAERDEPYLRNWAHRTHAYKFRDRDDLDSVVNAAVAFAVKRYRSDKGMKFTTYAQERIRTFILDHQRDVMGLRRRFHFGPSAMEEITSVTKYVGKRQHARQVSLDGSDDALHHILSAEVVDPIEQFHSSDLSHYCRGLDEREHKIILLSFRDGLTMREIGIDMGLSESRISQLRVQALGHIRTRIEEDEAKGQGKEND